MVYKKGTERDNKTISKTKSENNKQEIASALQTPHPNPNGNFIVINEHRLELPFGKLMKKNWKALGALKSVSGKRKKKRNEKKS